MKVLVFLEQRNGKLKNSAYEALTLGRKLSGSAASVAGVMIGEGIDSLVKSVTGYGADTVYLANNSSLANYNVLKFQKVLQRAIDSFKPDVILASASPMGRDVLPRLAAKNDSGIITDAVAVELNGTALTAIKPMYAGKCLVEMKIENSPMQFISVRPNVIKAQKSDDGKAEIHNLDVTGLDSNVLQTVEIRKGDSERVDLTEASIIVSGGRSLGSADNFKIIEECAAAIGASVGASRAAVDSGFRPHSYQVGQTGKTVTPKLYIACGISGAIQHLAGMRTSKVIVAINSDPDAPIFSVCDYGIVGDLFEVVPLLTKKFKSMM